MNFDQFWIVTSTLSLLTTVHGQLVILWIWYQLVFNDSVFWKLSQESFTLISAHRKCFTKIAIRL